LQISVVELQNGTSLEYTTDIFQSTTFRQRSSLILCTSTHIINLQYIEVYICHGHRVVLRYLFTQEEGGAATLVFRGTLVMG